MVLIGELIIVAIICVLSERYGHGRGRAAGYKRGLMDADNWWLGIEQSIDQARQKIWLDEAKPKKGWP